MVGVEGRASELQNAGSVGRIRVDSCASGQVRAPYSGLKGRGYGGSRMEVLGEGLGLTGVFLVRSELRIRGYREGVMVGPESRFWGKD